MAPRIEPLRVNQITGTFVLVILAVLVASVVWMGRSQRWFRSSVRLQIVLPEAGAAGIRQGSEVYFLGTLVGSVADVAVDARGRMEARANIRRDFFLFVREDSSAVVKMKFGVAGDSFFEITRGEGKPLPEERASIVCKEQFQSALEAAVEDVRRETMLMLKKVNGGLDAWTKLGSDLGETRERLDRLAVHLENIAAGVEAGKGTVGQLLTETALADAAQKLVERTHETMGGLQGVVTNLDAAVKNVQAGTARLPEITASVADGAKELPELAQQARVSMRELERLIEAMQRHWLVRKHVNPTNPPPARPLSAPPAKTPARSPFTPPRTSKGAGR